MALASATGQARTLPASQVSWTWHSLRHVFCVTALFTWGLDARDVSLMAGHANVRTTSTCTSVPPPACWTAPVPPPNNHARPR